MTINSTSILDTLVSHALTSGHFQVVNRHEMKSAPTGIGTFAEIWLDALRPCRSSGLASTCALLQYMVRIRTNMMTEPADEIDPRILAATDYLMNAYSGDFELGGQVRCIDLLGMEDQPLSARAGYLRHDSKNYRVMTITLPIIINDAWTQAP